MSVFALLKVKSDYIMWPLLVVPLPPQLTVIPPLLVIVLPLLNIPPPPVLPPTPSTSLPPLSPPCLCLSSCCSYCFELHLNVLASHSGSSGDERDEGEKKICCSPKPKTYCLLYVSHFEHGPQGS